MALLRRLALDREIAGSLQTQISGQLKKLIQIGELTPLGQFIAGEDDHLKLVTVWPHELANGKPVYPRP